MGLGWRHSKLLGEPVPTSPSPPKGSKCSDRGKKPHWEAGRGQAHRHFAVYSPPAAFLTRKPSNCNKFPPKKKTSSSLWEMIFPQWGEQGWGWPRVTAKHTRSLSQHGHIPVPGPRQHRPAAWTRAAPRRRHRASFSPARPLVQAPVTPSNAFFFSSLLWGWNYSGFVRKKKKKWL